MIYCIDTSALIRAYRDYPSAVFTSLWKDIEKDCESHIIISPYDVVGELEIDDGDKLWQWAKGIESLKYNLDEDLQKSLKVVLKKCHPFVNLDSGRSGCDPIIVALALAKGAAVVSQESPRKSEQSPFKIPDACQAFDIEHFRFLEFVKHRGWKY